VAATIGSVRTADIQAKVDANQQKITQAVNSAETGSRSQQQTLDQAKFEADQESRRTALLQTYIPDLIHGSPDQQADARAMLFVLFPNDIAGVLTRVQDALNSTNSVGDALRQYLNAIANAQRDGELAAITLQAEQLNDSTGQWAIVLGAYQAPKKAHNIARAIESKGYTPAFVYSRSLPNDNKSKLEYPVLVGYPTESEADSVLLAIRAEPGVAGAFVVNINKWCVNSQPDSRDPRSLTCQ
jgi:hypothetical protein